MERYAECLKIHQLLNGKRDGCQEFMPEEYRTFICVICGCHRNFHRKVEAPVNYKTEVVYTKCHKIHDFGSQVSVDGCQEFRPRGKDGTAEALTCALCGCDKGFHRNEIITQGQLMQMTMMTRPSFNTELYYLNKEDRLLRWLLVKHRELRFGTDYVDEEDATSELRSFRSNLFDDEKIEEDEDNDDKHEMDEQSEPT